jgi:hypothetical protein
MFLEIQMFMFSVLVFPRWSSEQAVLNNQEGTSPFIFHLIRPEIFLMNTNTSPPQPMAVQLTCRPGSGPIRELVL